MNLVQHKKTGFWYPDGSGSQNAIKEAYYLKDYGGLPSEATFKDSVVMDCGAHIGTFSRRALEEGAKQVVCYEPFPFCAESLRRNLPESSEIVEAAIVSDSSPQTLDFYYRPQRLEGATLIHKGANHTRWNFQTMTVKTVRFWEELERVRPSILKMDIEGAEWEILEGRQIPDFVESLFIEVHQLYSKGAEAGLDFISSAFPNSRKVSHTELVPFKSKPDKVTNVSALFVRI
jgi:FkbM family methyltransferase